MSDKDYTAILLEEIRDQNKAVLEVVGNMQEKVAIIPAMREDISELKQDLKIVKAAVTDLSHPVASHERHIADLEVA